MKKLSVVVLVALLFSMVTYGQYQTGYWANNSETWTTAAVGIGTDEPEQMLHIKSGSPKIVLDGGSSKWWFYARFDGSLRFSDLNGGGLRMIIDNDGNIGMGTVSPDYKLDVNGTIRAKEIKVETGWSDFVFADNYQLMPLDKLEQHIKANKSLPGIPTEKEVADNGIELGNMQAKFLEKIEELTLYVIKQNKKISELEEKIATLEAEN